MLVSGDGVVDIDEREAAQERKLASQPRQAHQVHYVHLVVSLVHLVVSSISTTPSPETDIFMYQFYPLAGFWREQRSRDARIMAR